LMEFGGRYHELNQVLGLEVARIGHRLLDVADRDDKIAILKYAAKLDTVVDFNQGRQDLENVFDQLSTPVVSEANFYDALLETLHRMRDVSGRKAIIVISTGVDTFSKADYQQVLQVAQTSATPIYTIGLVRLMQRESEVYGPTAPISRIDWNGAEAHLEMLARVSGGRAYVLDSDTELPAIYDDIMENLRLRYVVTYVSSNTATSGPPRKIRVDLIDPRTGEALKIRDSNGKLIAARVFVQETYSPKSAAGG
jgi:Ca-activated chloride channel family protein